MISVETASIYVAVRNGCHSLDALREATGLNKKVLSNRLFYLRKLGHVAHRPTGWAVVSDGPQEITAGRPTRPQRKARTIVTEWVKCADRLPDDDMTCLLALSDGEVTTGWHEDGRWHDIGAWPYDDHQVTDWAEMPEAPR